MAKSQREKGKRGERDFRDLLRAYGYAAERDGTKDGDLKGDLPPGFHFEVKFCETLKIPQWVAQSYGDAKPGEIPVVAFRRSRLNGDILGNWHIIEPADQWIARLTLV